MLQGLGIMFVGGWCVKVGFERIKVNQPAMKWFLWGLFIFIVGMGVISNALY